VLTALIQHDRPDERDAANGEVGPKGLGWNGTRTNSWRRIALRGRLITVAVLGLLAAGAVVSPALAGHQKVKHFATTISIKTDKAAGTISGKVTSANDACAVHRSVHLYVDGSDVYHQNTKAGGTYGIVHGSQQNPQPLDPGDYQVKAPKKTLTPTKVCDAGHSKVSTVK
jgi:hypothetical protein